MLFRSDENVDNKEETCEEKIAKLELEVQEWKNSYTRKLAEFQNFTKRKETEVSEMKKYASEGIIIKPSDSLLKCFQCNLSIANTSLSEESESASSIPSIVSFTAGTMFKFTLAPLTSSLIATAMPPMPQFLHFFTS